MTISAVGHLDQPGLWTLISERGKRKDHMLIPTQRISKPVVFFFLLQDWSDERAIWLMRNFGDNAPRARKETNKQKQNKTKTVNWPPIPYQYNLILKKPERKIPCYFLGNVSYPETACMTVSLKFSDINLSSISTSWGETQPLWSSMGPSWRYGNPFKF